MCRKCRRTACQRCGATRSSAVTALAHRELRASEQRIGAVVDLQVLPFVVDGDRLQAPDTTRGIGVQTDRADEGVSFALLEGEERSAGAAARSDDLSAYAADPAGV